MITINLAFNGCFVQYLNYTLSLTYAWKKGKKIKWLVHTIEIWCCKHHVKLATARAMAEINEQSKRRQGETEDVEEPLVVTDDSSSSSTGVIFMVLSQFFTKLSSFILNQVLIRIVSPKAFGISAYMEFLLSMVLFYSREAARLAVQRSQLVYEDEDEVSRNTQRKNLYQSIVNFGFVPLISCLPLLILIYVWQTTTTMFVDAVHLIPYFELSLFVVAFLVIIELATEPAFALIQYSLNLKYRSEVESYAVTAKCIATFAFLFIGKYYLKSSVSLDSVAVLAFAMGQLCYSLVLFIYYNLKFDSLRYSGALKVKKIKEEKSTYYFRPEVVLSWRSLFIQTLFKYFLSEGDHLIINYLFTADAQGVYSLVDNYGSIIARLLFLPIEESTRLHFTKLLSAPKRQNIIDSLNLLKYVCIFYANLCILIFISGYINGPFLLKVLLGNKNQWSQTSVFDTFRQFIFYIPFLAFNGILEAMLSSIATPKDIQKHSLFLSLLSVLVLVVLYILVSTLHLDLLGLIITNSLNMAFRIIYCIVFLHKYYSAKGLLLNISSALSRIKVSILTGILCVAAHYFVLNDKLVSQTYIDVLKSGFICLATLSAIIFLERKTLQAFLPGISKRKTQ